MVTALLGLVMVVGLVGVVVPLLPGTSLILLAGVVWAAFVADGSGRWFVVAAMAVLFVVGAVLKYVLPGRRLAGRLERSTLVAGVVGAVVGLFVLFPLGLVLGGVLGVYVAEAVRLRSVSAAVPATVRVLQAIGLGVLAELTAGALMIAFWLAAVVFA